MTDDNQEDHSEDSEILVGLWDCPYCGTKGISGDAGKCQCGASRPNDPELFYLPTTARVVTNVTAADTEADWLCETCDTSVIIAHTTCHGCGSPRDGAKQREIVTYASDADIPRESPRTRRQRKTNPLPPSMITHLAGENGDTISDEDYALMMKGVWVVGVILLLVGIWWLLTPHETKLTVAHTTWERTINLQEERTVSEKGWSVPSGGRQTASGQAFHHNDNRKVGERPVVCHPGGHRKKVGTRNEKCHSSDRVKTGSHREKSSTTNLGNGRFRQNYRTVDDYGYRSCTHTCSEDVHQTFDCEHTCMEDVRKDFPIYATQYTYDVERWFDIAPAKAVGQDSQPHWPEVVTDAKHQKGKSIETLSVTLTDTKGRTFTVTPEMAYWSSIKSGMHCTAMISRAGIMSDLPICK